MVRTSETMSWTSVWIMDWKVAKKTEVGSIIGQHEMVVTWLGVLAPKVEIKMSGNLQKKEPKIGEPSRGLKKKKNKAHERGSLRTRVRTAGKKIRQKHTLSPDWSWA